MKNLLVIAFHYPPDNSSTGVLRTAKFTEYLLRHDWRSHVVTAPSSLYASRNPESADAIPLQVAVDRAWGCDVKKIFGFRGVYPSWLGIPDRYWPWFFAARSAGARAIRGKEIKAIYSTYPLPTAHLVGWSLKKRFGLPWIADFRDPWATEGETGLAAKIEIFLERKVVSAADRVICNTPAMRRSFLARYPELPAERFVTITNGYDEKDFSAIVPVPAPRFQIFYPGSIDSENRNPKGLFAGIRYALDRGWLNGEDLRVVFLGCGPYADSERFRGDLASFALEPYVEIVKDRIPYRDALARMAGSDVVVVLSEHLTEDGRESSIHEWTAMQVPAKLYEYLRIGRPLLAIVGDGAVKELLEKTGAGTPLRSRDTEQIALALKRYYETRQQALPTPCEVNSNISEYSRENLTGMLAQELNLIVSAQDAH
ncbi:MAG: glycosyltransferase [Rhodocyclaceae bacterium]|nr:glycosyltransferase [Rhodocyclaceae bacterium]